MTSPGHHRSLEEAIVDTVREPLIVLDGELRIVVASRSFYQAFAVTRQETEGRALFELGNGQWNIPALRKLLEDIIPLHTTVEEFEVEHDERLADGIDDGFFEGAVALRAGHRNFLKPSARRNGRPGRGFLQFTAA